MADDAAKAITGLLDELLDAYTNARVTDAVALFAESPQLVGTGVDELRFSKQEAQAQIERDLSQADSISASYSDLRADGAGDTAWCYAAVNVEARVGGETVVMPIRFTATARNTDAGWKFVQAHFSVPAGDQAEGDSFTSPA